MTSWSSMKRGEREEKQYGHASRFKIIDKYIKCDDISTRLMFSKADQHKWSFQMHCRQLFHIHVFNKQADAIWQAKYAAMFTKITFSAFLYATLFRAGKNAVVQLWGIHLFGFHSLEFPVYIWDNLLATYFYYLCWSCWITAL